MKSEEANRFICNILKKRIMRKVIVLAMVLALSGTGIAAYGQTRADAVKEARKERKATDREAEKALNERSVKAARKEARRLKKEGWSVSPGALPLEKQLDRAYTMQYEYDTDNYPKYIMADAQSVGQNYDAAKMQAMELAKQNLVGQIETAMTSIVENSVANRQLDAGEAASVVKTLVAGKNVIMQRIGRILPVTECYRSLPNGNKEVLVRIAYSSDAAKKVVRDYVGQQLESEGRELQEELDMYFGI